MQVCEERPRVVIACCRSPHVLEQLAHVLCHHRCCCEVPGWARATERVVCECAVLVHDSRQPQHKACKWLAPPVITPTLTAVARSTSTCNLYACVVRCISYTHKHTADTCCTPTKGTHHRFTKCQQAAETAFWMFAVFSIMFWFWSCVRCIAGPWHRFASFQSNSGMIAQITSCVRFYCSLCSTPMCPCSM